MSKFLTESRKKRFSIMLTIIFTVWGLFHYGMIVPVGLFLWSLPALLLCVVIEEIFPNNDNDPLKMFAMVWLLPCTIMFALLLLMFNINHVANFIITLIKVLLDLD